MCFGDHVPTPKSKTRWHSNVERCRRLPLPFWQPSPLLTRDKIQETPRISRTKLQYRINNLSQCNKHFDNFKAYFAGESLPQFLGTLAASRTLIPPLPFSRPCAQWGVLIAIAKLWREGREKSHTRGIQSGRTPPTDRPTDRGREFLSFLRVGFADSDLQSFLASWSEGGRGRAEVQFGLPPPFSRSDAHGHIYLRIPPLGAPKTQHFFIFPLNSSVPSPTLRERKYTATLLICENVQHRLFEPFTIASWNLFPLIFSVPGRRHRLDRHVNGLREEEQRRRDIWQPAQSPRSIAGIVLFLVFLIFLPQPRPRADEAHCAPVVEGGAARQGTKEERVRALLGYNST